MLGVWGTPTTAAYRLDATDKEGSRRIKRREVELDPQVSLEEITSRDVELGCES